MSVPLRDFFAAHAAAALIARGIEPSLAAKQAYDVADALMVEREHRDESDGLAEPPPAEQLPDEERFDRPHLLDEPLPPFDDEDRGDVFDPRWEDLADPTYDRDARFTEVSPQSPRPGLARTQPTQVELPISLDPPRKRSRSA